MIEIRHLVKDLLETIKKEKRWTRVQLAKALDTNRSTLDNWLAAKTLPNTIHTFRIMAIGFDTGVAFKKRVTAYMKENIQ